MTFRETRKWLNSHYLGGKAKRSQKTHAEMRPVERLLMSRYSCHDSMLALWGATPSALSTSATRSRSATETTSWGPNRDLKILPYILLCFICKRGATLSKITKTQLKKLVFTPEEIYCHKCFDCYLKNFLCWATTFTFTLASCKINN